MKQKMIFLAFVIITVSITWGCGRQASKLAALERSIKPVPAFVAGAWVERGEDTTWRMVIEPNGIVSSAVIPLMTTAVRPHQTTKVEMIDGSFSTFTAGDMFAEYNPDTRELFVFIEVKNYKVRIQDVRTGGHTIYRFTGPVSEDGRVWKPEYIGILDYGPDLPIDYNNVENEPLQIVFDKVEEKQGPMVQNH